MWRHGWTSIGREVEHAGRDAGVPPAYAMWMRPTGLTAALPRVSTAST